MAYGMGQLRKAGQALADMDRAYAGKVESHIDVNKQPLVGMGSTVPLADVFTPGQADSQAEKVLLAAMDAGVLTANVASRYALPAGGITLAGKGLYDLTTQFGGPADGQEPNQLSM
jgi:hypothetical protein